MLIFRKPATSELLITDDHVTRELRELPIS
jgi:hypothetical protein